MKAVGTPVVVSDGHTMPLKQVKIGVEGLHSERWLQELINEHPELLPLDQIEPGLAPLIPVCMELPLRCGFLDNLFATRDGDIVIVEVKLWKNPQMRREVLAQALDYASALFDMNYEELDLAIQSAEVAKEGSFYDIISGPDTVDEAEFIDAVSHRLKTGRIVVLVVGDGIRSELEALNEGLQAHAGFRFTFGLVELSVFFSQNEDLTIIPQTLLATHRVERGVIEVNGAASFTPNQTRVRKPKETVQTLSSDAFYDAMEKIELGLSAKIGSLLDALEPLGVYPEYKKSLILRWGTPDGETANIGYIMRSGDFWTDQLLDSCGNSDAAYSFLNSLSESFGLRIEEMSGRPTLRLNGKAPKVRELVDSPEHWVEALKDLRGAFKSVR